jgi:hypothetical protein
MFKELYKSIKVQRFFWPVIAVFSFNTSAGWVFRRFVADPIVLETGSAVFRSMEENLFNFFWSVLGYFLHSVFATYGYIAWADGKGLGEGFKVGLLVAFMESSMVFGLAHYIAFPPSLLWTYIAFIFFFNSIDGILSVGIFGSNKISA